jgi:hypothetical protein
MKRARAIATAAPWSRTYESRPTAESNQDNGIVASRVQSHAADGWSHRVTLAHLGDIPHTYPRNWH